MYNTLKTKTKYAHSVCGSSTQKDWNGSVREPYEGSLYERTFMSEPFIEKHAISTELYRDGGAGDWGGFRPPPPTLCQNKYS